MDRPHYTEALSRMDLLETLAPFDPRVAGTPPLGLDAPTSDIDVDGRTKLTPYRARRKNA
ncbi:DUF4269 domain-containing protein [Rhizobium sp. YS-1r]|uniref:DUF4269 domain-containing protein n=1 Tax=Rhizobium sp. YS-1r TaxID=1532558 RepID=UPI0009E0AD40